MKHYKQSIQYVLFAIAVLNVPLTPAIQRIRRRNRRQELIILLLFFAENNSMMFDYITLRDVFAGYGRENWQDLIGGLRKSGFVKKVGHMTGLMLTEAGRAKARDINKNLQTEYKAIRKLYRNSTK